MIALLLGQIWNAAAGRSGADPDAAWCSRRRCTAALSCSALRFLAACLTIPSCCSFVIIFVAFMFTSSIVQRASNSASTDPRLWPLSILSSIARTMLFNLLKCCSCELLYVDRHDVPEASNLAKPPSTGFPSYSLTP